MRKVIILVAALLLWQISDARPISEEQARRNAASFLTSVQPRTKARVAPEELRLAWSFPEIVTKADDAPAFYVYSRPEGGFVVASGDDAARPVLAYSLEEKIPAYADMPENMRATYDWYAEIIAFAREKGWSSPATKAGNDNEGEVVLKTAPWNQSAPFNNLAPKLKGQECPIGCVATAIAIIMRYHEWPLKGVGTIPGYKYDNVNIDPVELGHEYDWSRMPYKAYGFSNIESAQIARLCYDVAVMVKMQFTPEGSGALVSDAWPLADYFGYDKSIKYSWRQDFHRQEDWERMLKDEINANRPVLYAGFTESWEGHAFVVDGYNGRFFSINYGWGGGSAFYSFEPIEEHEDELIDFTIYQQAVYNIKPDEGGKPSANLMQLDGVIVPYDLEENKPFTIRDNWVGIETFYPTDQHFNFTFSYILFDSKGAFKEQISPDFKRVLYTNIEYDNIAPVECQIKSKLADGDRISLCQLDPATGEWTPVSTDIFESIVFDKRPLGAVVQVGYDIDRAGVKDAVNGEKLYLYFRTLKDIPWVIYKEGSDTPVIWRCEIDFYNKQGAEQIMYEVDRNDDAWCLSYIWLPKGKYLAVFRNPLSGEDMKVHLEL